MKSLFTYLKRQAVVLLPQTVTAMIIDGVDTFVEGSRELGRGLLRLFLSLFTFLMVFFLFIGFPIAFVIFTIAYLLSSTYRVKVKEANDFAEKS